MLIPDKTQFTSDPIPLQYQFATEAYITITGPGPVYLELREEDGVWRRFPELSFYGPTAQRADLPRGEFRVVVEASAPTTVGVRV